MNHSELTAVIHKLSFDLLDARLEHVSDGDNRIQLTFKGFMEGEDFPRRFFIVIDFLPTHLDIYPTFHPQKAPAQPQAFTMLLRKYILNHELTGLRIADDDRIVTFEFGFDNAPYYELIAELTGRAPHIFFIESESRRILGCIGNDETRKIHDIYVKPEPHLPQQPESGYDAMTSTALYAALDGQFLARDEKERVDALRNRALKRIGRSLTKCEKLVATLTKELFRAESSERERYEADLLNAYAWQLKQGMLVAELPDFTTGEPVHIALDPALSIRENIEKRYAHSRRMIRSRQQVATRLEAAKARAEVLKTLRDTVTAAKDSSPILELESEINAVCAPDEKNQPQAPIKSKTKQGVHKPYKTFKSADGTLILVGKSAKDNDDLTFHHTRGNDTWLHISSMPGSHVVIKSAEPSQETLIDAALLALHYSKLSKNESAEVHVTQVKYVRKPKGAPDGKVEIRGEKKMIAKSSEKRLARLMATES
ncbi:MAG: DUF814 domain-containing protein [Proteobacteria bacterium]|nr:DUF814 domain-containing protein [Pseudomonadota bacterium]